MVGADRPLPVPDVRPVGDGNYRDKVLGLSRQVVPEIGLL